VHPEASQQQNPGFDNRKRSDNLGRNTFGDNSDLDTLFEVEHGILQASLNVTGNLGVELSAEREPRQTEDSQRAVYLFMSMLELAPTSGKLKYTIYRQDLFTSMTLIKCPVRMKRSNHLLSHAMAINFS
jgi:hypothetical protein